MKSNVVIILVLLSGLAACKKGEPVTLATVSTSSVTNISQISATGGGNVTSDGGSQVTSRGVCWSTNEDPAISNSKTTDGTGTGTFTSSLASLAENTTYFLKAYATNSEGTSYGDEISFITLPAPLQDIEGNSYDAIRIGTQVWMKENLKTTKFNDNTAIPIVTDNTAWSNLTTPGYCLYNNEINNKSTYGVLYNWYAVNTGKICPTGWHVPTDTEWSTLTTSLGGESVAGGKLKETGTSHWLDNTGANNETGFTALPGGSRGFGGGFHNIQLQSLIWSASESSTADAWYRELSFAFITVTKNEISKKSGLSVRCLKDN